MMNRPKRLVAAMSLLMAGAVQGQDLLGVYDLALQNDPVIREAQQQLAAVLETKPQAKALLLPNIEFDADASRVRTDVKSTRGSAPTGDDTYNDTGLSISLVQPVYNREYWVQLQQADDVIAAAEAQYADARLDLMARVIQAYFNVLASQDNLTVSKGQSEANLRQLDQAKQRFEVGLIAITDVHEAQAAYDGSRADQIAAANAVDDAWEALLTIIGYHREPLAILGAKLPLNPPVPADIEEWASTAVQQNYNVVAAESQTEALKKGIEIQRSGHYPDLNLVASYGNDNNRLDPGGRNVDTGTIGLQFNLPIYQGGAVTSRTREAQADYQGSMEILDQTRREVNQQTRNAYRGVLTSIEEVGARKATVVSSQSALESTQAGYDVGTRTLVDVLTVQTNLFDATRNYLGSRYEYIINGLLLKRTASTLTRQDLETVNAWLEEPQPGGEAGDEVKKNLDALKAGQGQRKP